MINTTVDATRRAADHLGAVPIATSHQEQMIGHGQVNVTPHGYQYIPGNHRRKEKFRERKGGGITGDKGPRFGERGGKNNPNTQWFSEMHFQKKKAKATGNWDAYRQWQQNNPKPVKQ